MKLPSPTIRQYAIADYLQFGPRRKVVEAFRGIGKSWITAAYVMWRLYCDPQLNILVVSASKNRADNFTTFCRLLIDQIPVLSHLRPRPGQRDSKVSFDVGPAEADQTPSVMSAGITGQITGFRADEIIPDDVEVPANSATQLMREKLAESIKEFEALLKPTETSRITFLGTPQTESSIYNQLGQRGYDIRIWPAEYPGDKQRAEYGPRLAPDIIAEIERNPNLLGHSTEPSRFTDMDLAERKLSYGRAGYGLQFMLSTRMSDMERYPLKLADLCVMNLDPENGPERTIWAGTPELVIQDLPNVGMAGDRLYRPVPLPDTRYLPYTNRIMAIDPSGKGKDETGWVVLTSLHGYLFLLDAGGFRDGYGPATLEGLAGIAQRYQVQRILIEDNFGDGMFNALFRPVLCRFWPTTIEPVKHSMQKEKRICDTLEPIVQSHRLVVNARLILRDFNSTVEYPAEVAHQYQLFYQFTRLTRDKGALARDDRLDALAIGAGYFARQMSQDTQRAVQSARDRAMDEELKKFMQHATGRKDIYNGPRFAKVHGR